ncbi:MAG: succinate dehydrogenase [Chromatiales bacterium]|jgi:fumarate reductase subunit C|nr:succinate dehydrogenase [Chromatiales bacterium]
MIPIVLVHLGVIIFAVRGGLSAAEILGRTQGSVGWGVFYGLFVIAVSTHAGFGLRNILTEWTALPKAACVGFAHLFMLLLALLGARAVYAVVIA